MSLDGTTIAAIVDEFQEKLLRARVDKIYQPKDNLLTFRVRQPGKNIKFLLSANPRNPRVYITKQNFENPKQAPNFCMILRKYLQHGRIKKVIQPDFERMLEIIVQVKTDSGDLVDYTLIIELMGRHSNIILTAPDGEILGAIKHVTKKMSRHREIIPGKKYNTPPKQDKNNPLEASWTEFKELLTNQINQAVYRAIMNSYRGIGPLMAIEIAFRANLEKSKELKKIKEIKALWPAFENLFNKISNKEFNPNLILDQNNNFEAYAAIKLKQYNDLNTQQYDSISNLLDFYFTEKIERKAYNRLYQKISKTLKDNFENLAKKERRLKGQLKGAQNAEKHKLKGELITANIYQLEKGLKKVNLENYYDENNKEITIELDPELEPYENAEKYFNKYEKAKKSVKFLKIELQKLENERIYLEEVENSLEQAKNSQELAEIEEELIEEGYISNQQKNPNKRDKKMPPLKFISSDGYQILVGRNNKQNDKLTKKIANNQDTWLHVKEIAGSHTIIKNDTGKKIPEQTLYEAAVIASYHSKAKQSSNVPVDYTKVKYVKKPKGVKPGLVNYRKHKTLYVDPDEALVKELKD